MDDMNFRFRRNRKLSWRDGIAADASADVSPNSPECFEGRRLLSAAAAAVAGLRGRDRGTRVRPAEGIQAYHYSQTLSSLQGLDVPKSQGPQQPSIARLRG